MIHMYLIRVDVFIFVVTDTQQFFVILFVKRNLESKIISGISCEGVNNVGTLLYFIPN